MEGGGSNVWFSENSPVDGAPQIDSGNFTALSTDGACVLEVSYATLELPEFEGFILN